MKGVECLKKFFIIFSIFFLSSLIIMYTYRLIYFYNLENGFKDDNKNYLSNKLEKTINVQDTNGGLYIIEDEYIYKYDVNDNYLWYSGQLWRILKINSDKTIDMVMDNSLSILNLNYENTSYIESYLSEFYNKLDKEFLVELDYCSDVFDNLDNIKCESKTKSNITLLDIYIYNKIGGNTSFINNKNSFWLINEDSNGNNWYINTDGSLSIGEDVNSFGIRPVVRLKSEIELISGDGTINNPYIIKNSNDLNIGEYVKFNDSLWRIVDLDGKITMLKEECLNINGKCILNNFGNSNVFLESSLYDYLNTTYYGSIIDKEYIVKTEFEIGDYIKYNYKNTSLKKIDALIGISKVGTYYISGKTNSYLLTTNDLEAIYSINENNNYYLTLPSDNKKIYPVLSLDINLNIKFGDGTIKNPYELSR